MSEHDFLAERFEQERPQLRRIAYRLLGTVDEADDAVQEAWIRLGRTDDSNVENLGAWLTTVVSRVCLDMLRTRRARREDFVGSWMPEPIVAVDGGPTPEEEALIADGVGLALYVVLETLAPAERLAFVLHDMFALPFDEIASIVGRSPEAARQLASRARRRVQGATQVPDIELAEQKRLVEAFLTAARDNDLAGLLAVLDPDIELRADAAAVALGGHPAVRGAETVAQQFAGRAQAAWAGLVDGALAIVVAPRGRLLLVLLPTIEGGRIAALEAIADPDRLRQLAITTFD